MIHVYNKIYEYLCIKKLQKNANLAKILQKCY